MHLLEEGWTPLPACVSFAPSSSPLSFLSFLFPCPCPHFGTVHILVALKACPGSDTIAKVTLVFYAASFYRNMGSFSQVFCCCLTLSVFHFFLSFLINIHLPTSFRPPSQPPAHNHPSSLATRRSTCLRRPKSLHRVPPSARMGKIWTRLACLPTTCFHSCRLMTLQRTATL